MNPTNMIIIFLMIVCPFMLINSLELENIKIAQYKTLEINRILDTATIDGSNALVKMGRNKEFIIDKNDAVETFLNTMYLNLEIMDNSILKQRLTAYIPAILIIDIDGCYVLSQDEYINLSGEKEMKLTWKPKKLYVYQQDNLAYNFTLTDYVTVYNITTKIFNNGTYAELKNKNIITMSSGKFEEIRRRTIIDNIEKDLSFYTIKHNEIAKTYGINYNFGLPVIENDDWNRTIDDVGMLVFFQGFPLGISNEKYNNYAFGGATIVHVKKYYTDINGKYYHKITTCPKITSSYEVKNSTQECASKGFRPCLECDP